MTSPRAKKYRLPVGHEEIFANDWVSMHIAHAHGEDYVYSHETRCDGHIVAALPFRIGTLNQPEFLLHESVTPCWQHGERTLASFTGGWEGGDFFDDVIREIREEAGYTITHDLIVSLGTSYGSKSSDTIYHLFSVNLTGIEPEQYLQPETPLEALARPCWCSRTDLMRARDPLVSVMALRSELA
jgi:8-oxo-dGTP pyrophosphatase MutT (NUDIX family)